MDEAAVVAHRATHGNGVGVSGNCARAARVVDRTASKGTRHTAHIIAVARDVGVDHHIVDGATADIAKHALVGEFQRARNATDGMAVAVEGTDERMLRCADRHPYMGAHVDIGGKVDDSAAGDIIATLTVEAIHRTDEPSQAVGVADGDGTAIYAIAWCSCCKSGDRSRPGVARSHVDEMRDEVM